MSGVVSGSVRERAVEIVVSLDAIRHNLAIVRQRAPGARVFAVVKADAYGHGAVEVARALGGDGRHESGPVDADTPGARHLTASADGFAVVTLDEAIALREAGITRPVLVMQGIRGTDTVADFRRYRLWPAVHHRDQFDRLVARAGADAGSDALAANLSAWLKVDTGMGRLGVLPDEVAAILEPSGVDWVGMMSHLACADEPDNEHTRRQIAVFDALPVPASVPRSLANSAAVLRWPGTAYDWVRPGLMLYGCDPFDGDMPTGIGTEPGCGLEPAMTVSAPLISVKRLTAGSGVGYAQTWLCDEEMPVGYAAIGYADGLPRVLSASADVLVDGRRCPVIGRVSMDSIAIDLRNAPAARIGERITLWGPGEPVERLAAAAGTISYELLTGIRGARRFV